MDSKRPYETVVVFDPDLPQEKKDGVFQRIREIISQFDGEIEKVESWGVRTLAYPIRKKEKGEYHIIYYWAKPGVVQALENYFRVNEEVMRFLSVLRKEKIKEGRDGGTAGSTETAGPGNPTAAT